MGRYTQVVLDTCAYAGTGNVLKVQEMLHLCAEHLDQKAEHQVGTRGDRRLISCDHFTDNASMKLRALTTSDISESFLREFTAVRMLKGEPQKYVPVPCS